MVPNENLLEKHWKTSRSVLWWAVVGCPINYCIKQNNGKKLLKSSISPLFCEENYKTGCCDVRKIELVNNFQVTVKDKVNWRMLNLAHIFIQLKMQKIWTGLFLEPDLAWTRKLWCFRNRNALDCVSLSSSVDIVRLFHHRRSPRSRCLEEQWQIQHKILVTVHSKISQCKSNEILFMRD